MRGSGVCSAMVHMWRPEKNPRGEFSPSTVWVSDTELGSQDWGQAPLPLEPACWPMHMLLTLEKDVGFFFFFYSANLLIVKYIQHDDYHLATWALLFSGASHIHFVVYFHQLPISRIPSELRLGAH